MESKALASILGLVENCGALNLEEVLQYCVTSECLSIFNANGTMRMVQKSKLLEKLTMTPIPEPAAYTSAPTTEDRGKADGTKYTWGDYAQKVVCSVTRRHKHVEQITCMNDPYDQNYIIKDSECMLCQKGTPISNVYMKSEDKLPPIKGFSG